MDNIKVIDNFLQHEKSRLYEHKYNGCPQTELSRTTYRHVGTYAYMQKLELERERDELRKMSPLFRHFANNIVMVNSDSPEEAPTPVDLNEFGLVKYIEIVNNVLDQNPNLKRDKEYLIKAICLQKSEDTNDYTPILF
jgi:hypothetical protein